MLAGAAAVSATTPAAAEAPDVVASIKPLHSIVASVMGDIATPHLLVAGGDSPHTYSMRPSDAEALSQADLVFWIGKDLEAFLAQPIANLGANARTVALIDTPGILVLDYDDDGHEHGHDHEHGHADDHDHDHDHDSTARDDDHDHGDDHDDHAHDEHAHAHDDDDHAHGEDGHHHTGRDPHVWLDPRNAATMAGAVADALAGVDPDNADAYRENAARYAAELSALEKRIAADLAPYREVPYLTFHESFGYFDNRFGLDSHGAITINPDRQPGAQRLEEIRAEIGGFDRVCIFAEPQFPPKIVDVIVEGTAARTGTLDPLGAALEPGPGLYGELMAGNAAEFARCFASTM